MLKFAWLLGRGSLRQLSASDPPKAIIVSELCGFTVIVRAYIHASGILYVGNEVSVFACVSCSSMVSGHNMGFICNAV